VTVAALFFFLNFLLLFPFGILGYTIHYKTSCNGLSMLSHLSFPLLVGLIYLLLLIYCITTNGEIFGDFVDINSEKIIASV
jgi:hypothetical protein